ncbi:MAG: omega-6 fatty acid desaturase (delta-12 desaturase) [Limisphaerales bacterium]|jgi:omega-6 fatty acid desaturase (delta-12 desaturase)
MLSDDRPALRGTSLKTSMRSGKELILATKPFAQDSTIRSWWCVLSTGGLLLAAMVGTILLEQLELRIASSVLAGLFALRFFVIYHDHQHLAILSRSRLADVLMRIFGLLALSPTSVWKSSHNYHHKHNSKLRSAHIGSFPVMTKEAFLKAPKSTRRNYLFIRHPLTILFGYIFAFLWGMCLSPFFNQPRQHADCLLGFILHVTLIGWLGTYFGWLAAVLALIVPCFIMHGIGAYLFYAQHNFSGVSFADKGGWTYEKAAMDSSSFMVTGPIMRWFTANIGYHHIHHLNAKVPFYRLPEVMQAIPELNSPKRTSLNPVEIFRCLRLKVWDPETQQMLSLRELRSAGSPA